MKTDMSSKLKYYQNCHFWGVASPGLGNFRGWPVQDSVFFWILAIGKFGGCKKDQTPCTKSEMLPYIIFVLKNQNRNSRDWH